MRKMKRQPTHPGKIIKEDYLEPLSLTVTDMAKKLGISIDQLEKVLEDLNEKKEKSRPAF